MLKPLLHPHQFVAKGALHIGDRGFEADFLVDAKARHSFLLERKFNVRHTSRKSLVERPPTRLVINPKHLPPNRLRAHFAASAGQHPRQLDLNRFLRGRHQYPTKLSVGPRYTNDDGLIVEEYLPEGQTIAVVGFLGDQPVGFIWLHLAATFSSVRKTVTVHTLLDLACVVPTSDGSGHILDLTVALCRIVQSLIEAAYRAAPRGANLQGSIDGDIHGATGKLLAEHVQLAMIKTFESLGRRGRRRTVSFGDVENHLAR